MCHTWALWSVDVHDIICVRSDQRVSQSWTLLKFLQIHNRERLCLNPLTVFKSSQWDLLHLIPMKSQCLAHTFCEAWHWGCKVMSLFSKLLYVHIEKVSQSSSIVFKSSAWFSLCVGIFCDKEGIGGMFITMNDSYKTVICNLHKLLSCLEMDHGSSKTAKIQELPRAFGPQTTKTLPWTHCGHCSPLAPSIISGFQLWATFTPAFR